MIEIAIAWHIIDDLETMDELPSSASLCDSTSQQMLKPKHIMSFASQSNRQHAQEHQQKARRP